MPGRRRPISLPGTAPLVRHGIGEAVSEQEKDESQALTADAQPAPAKSKKMLLIAGVATLLLAGGGAGAWFMLGSHGGEAAEAGAKAEKAPALVYVEVPPMMVNIADGDGRTRFLKVRVMLAVEDEKAAELAKAKMAAIIDPLLGFLRELRPEDLAGSQGMFRIKEEMLVRATQVLAPHPVHDVLIQELVQR